jgi:hypothetical protein
MPIETFDELIGTWARAGSGRSASASAAEREVFHFSPLGHFVMEWGDAEDPHVQICDVSLTEEGFVFRNRADGTAMELRATRNGRSLVLVPPHGQKTILRRVVEELEAEDFAFFVKGEG